MDLSNAIIGPPVKLPPGIVTGIAPPRDTGKARGKPKSTGSGLVKACLEYLAIKGIMAWRNNTTGVWDGAKKIFRTFQGRKGIADILGVLPGGRAFACECKEGTGRLTKEQRAFLADVERAGGLAVVVRDLRELMEVV